MRYFHFIPDDLSCISVFWLMCDLERAACRFRTTQGSVSCFIRCVQFLLQFCICLSCGCVCAVHGDWSRQADMKHVEIGLRVGSIGGTYCFLSHPHKIKGILTFTFSVKPTGVCDEPNQPFMLPMSNFKSVLPSATVSCYIGKRKKYSTAFTTTATKN